MRRRAEGRPGARLVDADEPDRRERGQVVLVLEVRLRGAHEAVVAAAVRLRALEADDVAVLGLVDDVLALADVDDGRAEARVREAAVSGRRLERRVRDKRRADDGVGPPPATDTDARHFTGPYRREIVAGVGHNFPQEAPDAFAAAIRALL